MSDRLKSILLRYGISMAAGGILAALTLNLHGYREMTELVDQYRLLCDAFTIPGVILLMVGLLVWIAGEGMFDSLTYLGRSFFWMFNQAKPVRYFDYIQEKRANRKHIRCGFLLLSGAIYLAVALIFMALFYKVY